MFRSLSHLGKYFKSSEGWLYVLIVLLWGQPLLGLFNAIVLRLPLIGALGPYMQTVVVVIAIVLSAPALIKRLNIFDIAFFIFCLGVYLIQYIAYPWSNELLDEYFVRVIFNTVPFYFIGRVLDIHRIDKALFVTSVLVIIYRFYDFMFGDYLSTVLEESNSAMWLSYNTLVHVLFAIWYCFRRFSLVSLLFSSLGVFLVMSYGSRGPFVLTLLFLAMCLLFFINKHYRIVAYIGCIALVFLIVSNFNPIMIGLESLMSESGLSTRVITQITGDALLDSSTRDDLLLLLQAPMEQMGTFGLGLFGAYKYLGIYSHRIYVDFWISFGYLFGSVLMLLLLRLYFKVFIKSDKVEKGMIMLLLVVGVGTLFFSLSYMIWPFFFLLIGYCVGRLRETQLSVIK